MTGPLYDNFPENRDFKCFLLESFMLLPQSFVAVQCISGSSGERDGKTYEIYYVGSSYFRIIYLAFSQQKSFGKQAYFLK